MSRSCFDLLGLGCYQSLDQQSICAAWEMRALI